MKLRFWGTRGSIPSPGIGTIKYGGNTTCLELILDDKSFVVFDAGTGIRKLGNSIIQNGLNGLIHLFLTHSHWDHIQGFPFFLPAYNERVKIKIFGCPPVYNKLREILTNQMESSYFPINFHDLKAAISFQKIDEIEHRIGNAKLSFIRNNHPGAAYGFKVTDNGKSIVFITDNELSNNQDCLHTTRNEFIKFCQGADILIHDAQYLEEEMVETNGYGHSSYEQAFSLGVDAKVKHLIFFHHEPDRSDDEIEAVLTRYQKKKDQLNISMKLDAAQEGLSYII